MPDNNPTQLFGIETTKQEAPAEQPAEPTREQKAIDAFLSGAIYKEKE